MLIHFKFLLLIYLMALVYRKLRDKNNKKANVIIFLIFILMSSFIGLRDISIGTDTYTYVYMFTSNFNQYSNLEILLPIIFRIIHIFTDRYCVCLLVLSFICIYGIYKNAKEYDFDTEYFLFLYLTSYCFLYSCSAIRFFCAFSIIMLSFKYMINKDTKKVLLLLFIACLFHTSAIIFIPFYFITRFKFNKKNYCLLLLMLLLLVLLEKIFGSGFLFNFELFQKYNYVILNQNGVGGISAIMNFGIMILSLIYYKSIVHYKNEYEFFLKMHAIGTALDFIGTAYRVIWFFRFPTWFLIPIILKNLKEKNKRDYMIIYVTFIIIYSVVYYYLLKVSLGSNNFLNYIFNTYFD